MQRFSTRALCLVVFLIGFDLSRPAFAYLDPGSGSMILQLLLGGIAGGIMMVKLYWERVTNIFRRKPSDPGSPPSSGNDR